MQRRVFLGGLLAAGCTPAPKADSLDAERYPIAAAGDGMQVVAVAEWNAPVMGESSSVAVFANGLVDRRYTRREAEGPHSLGRVVEEFRVALAAPDFIVRLRADLESTEFADAEPHYDEDGVLDGGSVTIASPAVRRRVIVINDPEDAPLRVRAAALRLRRIASWAETEGMDPFREGSVPGQGRMLLVHHHVRQVEDDSIVTTVYTNGTIETRTTYIGRAEDHRAHDFPTPRTTTHQAEPDEIKALEAAINEAASGGLEDRYGTPGGEGDRHFVVARGLTRRVLVLPGAPAPPALQRIIDLSLYI